MKGTRLRNFIASGGKASQFESCKGLEKAKASESKKK